MPQAYVILTTVLVLAQGLLWPDREAGLRDFYWASLFFILAVPALQYAPIGMDHFGFYALADLAGTHLPFMFSLLTCVAVASVCSLMFQLLWRWRGCRESANGRPLTGTLSTVVPPTTLAYVVILVLSNASIWIQSVVVLSVVTLVFIGLLLIRDTSVNPSQNQWRFLLFSTFTTALIGSSVGMMVILALFILPDVPSLLPDHNLLRSWEIDHEDLGYTRSEALDRVNVGYMWHAMYLYLYMVSAMCGSLLVALYRKAGGDGSGPDALHSGVLETLGMNREGPSETVKLVYRPLDFFSR